MPGVGEFMGDLDSKDIDTGVDKKERVRRWFFSSFAKKSVLVTFIVSLVIFLLYTGGSMPDPGLSDRILFLLLSLLRYSSLLLCAFSLLAMALRIRRLVDLPGWRNALGLFFYFSMALLGAGFAMINSLILAASGGRG